MVKWPDESGTIPYALVALRAWGVDTPHRVAIEEVNDEPARRAAEGKAVRRDRPRSGHAELSVDPRDPLEILRRQDESRVSELVPIRYGRMLASPFAFFRGAAAVMAAADGEIAAEQP